MNLNFYILASIVSHVLLIGLLYLTHPYQDTVPGIFNVDIVSPAEEDTFQLPKKIPPPAANKKPLLIKRRQKPQEKKLPPETLYGDGTGMPQEGFENSNNVEDTGKLNDNDSRSAEKRPIPSLSEKDNGLSSEKDTTYKDSLDFLFDKKTIEKYARKGSPAKKGLTFDASGFKHRGYMRMLKERIEDIWKYPKEAARKGLSGDLYMKFSIKRDGVLGEIELIRTSGHRELDEAAMKALKDAEPFWPLPDDWDKDTLEIKGHFIYIFGNTLVM